ncbi:MAG: hypothetical protein HDT47_08145 [Ruminococcaceae bacterium]|nr:hypothetical protein [Oscillospiraceae bacterium]
MEHVRSTRRTFTAKKEKAMDLSKIYEIVEDLYCANNGRPSTDLFASSVTVTKNFFKKSNIFLIKILL